MLLNSYGDPTISPIIAPIIVVIVLIYETLQFDPCIFGFAIDPFVIPFCESGGFEIFTVFLALNDQ